MTKGERNYIAEFSLGFHWFTVKTYRCTLFTLFFITIFVSNSFAQLKLVGRAMPGEAEATFVVDSLCYVAASDQVQMFNISNPANPKLLNNIIIPGAAADIYVEGDFAYVAARDSGFCIINISNTLNPLIASITNVGTSVYGIFYKENRAYLATTDSGLVIYDVLDPYSPIKLGTCKSFHTVSPTLNVYVQGNFAFVAAAYDGFIIIDVSNPYNPQQVYIYDQQDFWAYDVKVSGGWAFLSFDTYSSGAGLLTFQVPLNPANTRPINSASTNAPARRIDIGNGYAYLACLNGGLNIMNISNPNIPFLASTWVSGSSNNLFYLNNFIYLADQYRGLIILDVTNVNNISLKAKYDTQTYSRDIGIMGNYLYQAERDPAGLKVFDISEKTKPVLVFDETLFPDAGGVASEITAENNYLYLSTYNTFSGGRHQFRWYNVTNPANPQLIGIFDQTAYNIRAHYIQGTKAYLGNNSNIRVLDLSVERNPIPQLGYFSNNYNSITGIEVRGSLAFLATRSTGFCIVNIEHPSSMFEVSRIPTTSETFDVAVEGSYAYLADWEAGFRVVDISNPFQPVVVNSVQRYNERAVRVAVKNDTAYVSWDSYGIRLYDVSDPTQIIEIGYYKTRDPEQVRFNGEYVYLADDEAGLYIFKHGVVSSIYEPKQDQLPKDFYLTQNYPNPFNPSSQIEFYIPQSGQVTLSIYSITGQLVKSLVNKNLQPGLHSVTWNGKNESDTQASSGVYLYKLDYAGHQWVKKMILMR